MFLHLIFNIRASASVDADIRIGRRRHPHRSAQTSASVGADVRIGRRRRPHRSAQTPNVTLRLFFNNVRMSKY